MHCHATSVQQLCECNEGKSGWRNLIFWGSWTGWGGWHVGCGRGCIGGVHGAFWAVRGLGMHVGSQDELVGECMGASMCLLQSSLMLFLTVVGM